MDADNIATLISNGLSATASIAALAALIAAHKQNHHKIPQRQKKYRMCLPANTFLGIVS